MFGGRCSLRDVCFLCFVSCRLFLSACCFVVCCMACVVACLAFVCCPSLLVV